MQTNANRRNANRRIVPAEFVCLAERGLYFYTAVQKRVGSVPPLESRGWWVRWLRW